MKTRANSFHPSNFTTVLTVLSCFGLLVSAWLLRADDKPKAAQSGATVVPAAGYKNLGVAEFEKMRAEKGTVVLDVRTREEFEAGHVPGAVNLDVNTPDFQKQVAKLDKSKTYLVHCAAGGRSVKACKILSPLEFGKLYNLEGGFKAWEKAGHKPQK